MFGAGI